MLLPIMSQDLRRANEEHVVNCLQSLEYVSKISAPSHGEILDGNCLLGEDEGVSEYVNLIC